MGIFSKKRDRDIFDIIDEKQSEHVSFEIEEKNIKPQPDYVLTTDEILSDLSGKDQEDAEGTSNVSAFELMRQRMLKNIENSKEPTEEVIEQEHKEGKNADDTLLKRCEAYIVDENGIDASLPTEPLYKLESVADILKTDSQRRLEELSAKYDIIIEDVKDTAFLKTQEAEPKYEEKNIKKDNVQNKEQDIFEQIIKGLDDLKQEEQTEKLPDISDIDNKVSDKKKVQEEISNTATVRFTPVKFEDGERISISTVTRPIDLTGEIDEVGAASLPQSDDGHLEHTEFEDYTAKDEYLTASDAKRFVRKLSIKKRSAFLQLSGSLLVAILMGILSIPSIFILKNIQLGMMVSTILLGLSIIINGDMIIGIPKFFARRSTPDGIALTASVVTAVLGGFAAYERENQAALLFTASIILFFRALTKFYNVSAKLGNLRQILTGNRKKSVILLDNESTTFPMAKNAIEGDALIAVAKESSNVLDFVKYYDYSTPLGNRMRIVFGFALAIALIFGLAGASYVGSTINGLYIASVILCIAGLPTLFFIDALPNYKAAARLNKRGAMIAGIAAANHLELSNAVVVSSKQLFPDQTVTMYDMKVLSENNIDDIFVRAASLTEAIGSPLAPIFKRIAQTNKSYTLPDSDTVKYEDKMGLSGWVDDELMFIGNRTLMHAHGISVPDVEIDRKVLRRGFFPVYIATGGKACAMLMVRYSVDEKTAHELYRLTSLGVTVLVDNCDPNLTDEMICDYMGLYKDSVKAMTNSGVHMYRNAVAPTDSCSAPAAFKGNPLNLISVINCAARVKRSNLLLTVFYVIAAILGVAVFTYVAFSGSNNLPKANTILLCELGATVLSYLIFLFKKP